MRYEMRDVKWEEELGDRYYINNKMSGEGIGD